MDYTLDWVFVRSYPSSWGKDKKGERDELSLKEDWGKVSFYRDLILMGLLVFVTNSSQVTLLANLSVFYLVWQYDWDNSKQMKQIVYLFFGLIMCELLLSNWIGASLTATYYAFLEIHTVKSLRWMEQEYPEKIYRTSMGHRLPLTFVRDYPGLKIKRSGDNLCMWNQMFEDGQAMQKRFCDTLDGTMSPGFMEELSRLGFLRLVKIIGPEAALLYAEDSVLANEDAMEWVSFDENDCISTTEVSHRVSALDSSGRLSFSVAPFLGHVVMPENESSGRVVNTDVEELKILASATTKFVQDDSLSYETRAMAEFGYIVVRQELDLVLAMLAPIPMDECTIDQLWRLYLVNDDWKLWSKQAKRWLGKKPNSIQEGNLAWDGYRLQEIVYNDLAEPVWIGDSNWLLVVTSFVYRRGLPIANNILRLIDLPHATNTVMCQGVPGCGKTFSCAQLVKTNKANKMMTANKKSQLDVVRDYKIPCATFDALMVNYFKPGFSIVGWTSHTNDLALDEALLEHYGAIVLIIRMLRPERVFCHGDFRQIGPIPRIPNFIPRFSRLVHNQLQINTESRTAPASIRKLFDSFYPGGFKAAPGNDRIGEVKVFNITSVADVPKDYNLYMTWTKNDRDVVRDHVPGKDTGTTHERQGCRANDTCGIRLALTANPLFTRFPYWTVQGTRHKMRFHYFTTVRNDLFSQFLKGEYVPDNLPKMSDLLIQSGSLNATFLIRGLKDLSLSQIEAGDKKLDVLPTRPYFKMGGADTTAEWIWRRRLLLHPDGIDELMVLLRQVSHVGEQRSGWYSWWTAFKRKMIFVRNAEVKRPTAEEVNLYLADIYHWKNPEQTLIDRMDLPLLEPEFLVGEDKYASARLPTEPRLGLTPKLVYSPQRAHGEIHPVDLNVAAKKRVLGNTNIKIGLSRGLAVELVNKLEKHFIDPVRKEQAKQADLMNSKEYINLAWSLKTDKNKQEVLQADWLGTCGKTYTVSLKRDPKVEVGKQPVSGVTAVQLIMASNPLWVAYFSPIFSAFTEAIMASMKKKFVFCTRRSNEQISDIVDHFLSGKRFVVVEDDFSKFDKSQDEVILDARIELYYRFFVAWNDAFLWKSCNQQTKCVFPKWALKLWITHMMHTGAPDTWPGNTVTLALYLADFLTEEQFEALILALLNGDDNTLFLGELAVVWANHIRAAELLNLEVKTMTFHTSIYFSSKFIIVTRLGWMLVPDPLKIIARLGRTNLQGSEHLDEIHKSYKDNAYMYQDDEIMFEALEAAHFRYSDLLGLKLNDFLWMGGVLRGLLDDRNYLDTFYTGSAKAWALKLNEHEARADRSYKEDHLNFEYL